ncbi:glutathione S-transferase [Klebsiella pneumoniae]|nr:glutathione S-transferase GstB [Klebsiella pneumoniae]UMZ78775.1 glutathione S-transferase N-terminal domain-containing protein [Klebsiella pneumoniae]SBX35005.1 glutathione S-transferase [Klebsiella pneumoniae]SSL93328.1 glutathione S-transferase [Klebsiella pneumoniae]SVW08298.1 glutathione S-transferase [Klebsiella pneumoniae]
MFAGKKSAQIREILISESAWEEMTCLFAPSLEELDLPYQQILAGLEFGLNHDPEYLAMNPNGLVPLLKDDATGVVLWE